MNRQMVSSSRMTSVGWENNVLEIEFNDGSIYQYMNVTVSEYQAFMSSSSLGSALARFDKVHPYRKIR